MAPLFTGFKLAFGRFFLEDTSPRYSISASTTSVNEGSSVTFTVTTTNVNSGTTLYWTTNTVSGTVSTSDFNDSATSGSFTITNGSGSITRTLSNDASTEGTESFQLQIRTESISGTIVATSSTVTISDTSQAPTYITTASGGDLSAEATPDGNRYHVFYNPGNLTVPSPGYVDVLLVGGGASGFGGHGHGGAGGQVVLQTQVLLSSGPYPITVGTGAPPPGPLAPGQQGGNSTAFGYTGYGGGADPALPSYIPSPFLPARPGWGPGPEYGNIGNSGIAPSGLGAGGEGANPNTTWRPGGNGRQVPAPFLPTNAPANLVSALGSTPTAAPAWRYFGGGGGGGGGNGFESSKGGNGGLGGGGGGGTGPGGAGGDPGYGYPFPPGGPLGDAGQNRRGGGGGGGGIGACGTTYCPAKSGGSGVVVVRYPT